MLKLISPILFCLMIFTKSFGQDTAQVDNIFYWTQDKLSHQTIYFDSSISNCESQTTSSTFIVDSLGRKVNGWVIVKERNYIIARQLKNGVKCGYELEYCMNNEHYILKSIAIYSEDELASIIFQANFNQKKLKENNDLITSLESYRVWNSNKTNSKLISTSFKRLGNSKWKEIAYYFDPEFNSTTKLKSKIERDSTILRCELNTFNLTILPVVFSVEKLSRI